MGDAFQSVVLLHRLAHLAVADRIHNMCAGVKLCGAAMYLPCPGQGRSNGVKQRHLTGGFGLQQALRVVAQGGLVRAKRINSH